jgi:DNA processing protein
MSVDPAWVALCLISGVGGKTFKALMTAFGTPEAVLSASDEALRAVNGVGKVLSESIRRADIRRTELDLRRWSDKGVRALSFDNSDYPSSMKTLEDPPPLLFVRGQWPLDLTSALAIVGTRSPSRQAHQYAAELADEVVKKGRVVISGLAVGIDSAAHNGALDAEGQTVGVLGSGILNVYPPESKMLAERVIRSGALMCEVSPDAKVNTPALIARNRIITGLSTSVMVVQSNTDGGAMHAARFAVAQGRTLYTPKDILGDAAAAESLAELRRMGAVGW